MEACSDHKLDKHDFYLNYRGLTEGMADSTSVSFKLIIMMIKMESRIDWWIDISGAKDI